MRTVPPALELWIGILMPQLLGVRGKLHGELDRVPVVEADGDDEVPSEPA
jgi:hypothetical protein